MLVVINIEWPSWQGVEVLFVAWRMLEQLASFKKARMWLLQVMLLYVFRLYTQKDWSTYDVIMC